MARGVARPELRAELFAAADRIMAREGAVGLNSRAITEEAGCAKGILHNHFDGVDGFLTEYAVDRLSRTLAQLSGLAARAGHGDVVDNLVDAARGLFGSGAVTVAALIAGKPALTARISTAVDTAGTSLGAVESTFTEYLAAERDLGRVPVDVDVDVVAFTMVGAVHHLFFTGQGAELDPVRVRHIITTLLHR